MYLLDGTYIIDGAVTVPSNVTIAGAGQSTILKLKNGINANISMISNSVDVSGITFRDIVLDGNKANNSSGNQIGINIQNGSISNTTPGITIEQVTARNFRQYGTYVRNMNQLTIRNSLIDSNGSIGLYVSGGNDWVISGNKFNNNSSVGAQIMASSRVSVTGNIAKANGNYGIGLSTPRAVITGNHTASNAGAGIVPASYATVTGNTSDGDQFGTQFGASTVGVTYSGNTIYNATSHGIQVRSGGDYNAIIGNTITNSGTVTTTASGIYYQGRYSRIADNVITDNGGTGYAINLPDGNAVSNVLSGNIFSGTGATAINDAGATTIFAGQAMTAGGLDIRFKQAASTSAVNIQDANGINLLNADTTNGELQLGQYDATNPINGVLTFNNSSNTYTVKLQSGATSADYTLTLPTALGSSGDCLVDTNGSGVLGFTSCGGGTGSGVTTVGALDGGTYSDNGASISTTTIYLQEATATHTGLVTHSAQTFGGLKTFNDGLASGTISAVTDSTTGIRIQNAAGTQSILTVDTSNQRIGINTTPSSYNLEVSGTTQIGSTSSTGVFVIQNSGSQPILRVDSTNNKLNLQAAANATSFNPVYNAMSINMTGKYWNGSSSTSRTFTISQLVSTTGIDSRLAFMNNAGSEIMSFYDDGTSNFVGQLTAASFQGTALDTASAGTLNIGTTNATSINLNQNTTVASGKTLRLAGDTYANISGYGGPVDGMTTYDTTNKQLLVYNSALGKWQADKSDAILNSTIGIYASNMVNSVITGNTITDNTDTGIYSYGASSQHNTISSNAIDNNGYGIQMKGDYTVVDANTIANSSTYGISVEADHVTLSNNKINLSAQGGIAAQYSNYLTIHSNSVTATGSGFDPGIILYVTTRSVISGNDLSANLQGGIQLNGAVGLPSSDNKITGNIFYDNGGSGANDAIYLNTYATNTTITDNKITDTAGTGYAIRIGASTDSNTYLSGNTFSGTGATTINDASTSTIYAGQAMTAGGLDVRFKQAASSAAVSIQNGNGRNVLNVDTTNGEIELGEYNASNAVNGKIVFNNSTNANNVGIQSGATSTSYNLTLPTGLGSSGDCLSDTTGSGVLGWTSCGGAGGANTSLSNIASTNLSAALNVTSGDLNLTTTTSGNIVLDGAGTINLNDSVNINAGAVLGANQTISFTGGNTASRPGSPTEGMLYFDTSTHQLLQYNGTKWVSDRSTATKIVAMGPTTGCTGTTPTASQNYDGADYVDTSCTSAQTTINAAIAALPASGGTVYLLDGTYIVDGAINIGTNVILAGTDNATVLKLANSVNAAVNVINATGASGMVIRNLVIDGNRANNSSGTQTGINLSSSATNSAPGILIDGVSVSNFRSNGMYMSNINYVTITRSYVYNNATYGVSMTGVNYASVTSNYFASNQNYALYLSNSASARITNNTAVSNAQGLTVLTDGAIISGNKTVSNTNIGIYVSASYTTVSGNSSTGDSKGISINVGGKYNSITGNTVVNSGGYAIYMNGSNNNNELSNNTITNPGGSSNNGGIYLTGSYNLVNNNVITDTAGTGYAIYIPNSSQQYNILSSNLFYGTGATSIFDLGTGTVYSGQAIAANGQDIRFRQASSSSAVNIQDGNGVAVLNVNTTSGQIELGNYNGGTNAVSGKITFANVTNNYVVTLTSATQTTGSFTLSIPDLTGNDTICTMSSGCGGGGGGANQALSNLASVAINTSLISDTTNTDDLGSSAITWRSGYFGTSVYTPTIRPLADSATALQIQNNGGSQVLFQADTSNNRIKIGDSTASAAGDVTLLVLDNVPSTITPTGLAGAMYYDSTNNKFKCYTTGWVDCDTTGSGSSHVRTVKINPEFPSTVFSADGSNNTGFMTSDYDATAGRNYYAWTTDQGTAQDYDIVVQYQLPSGFTSFTSSSFTFWSYLDSGTSTDATVMIKDASGTSCYASAQSIKQTGSWTSTTISDPGNGCSFSANDTITFVIKPTAISPQTNLVRIGSFQFGFNENY